MTRKEKQLRLAIREHIKRFMLEAEEEETQDTEAEPEVEVEPEAEEMSMGTTLGNKFAEKLKNTPDGSSEETIQDVVVAIIDAFGMSNERKLALLKQIRNTIVQ